MYRYLDRPAMKLDDDDLFALSAMRCWVQAARTGRCPCAAIQSGFKSRNVQDATKAFLCVMTLIDRNGIGQFRFAPIGFDRVGDDEARLLALFAAARTNPQRLGRWTANLVVEEMGEPLAAAVVAVVSALRLKPRTKGRA